MPLTSRKGGMGEERMSSLRKEIFRVQHCCTSRSFGVAERDQAPSDPPRNTSDIWLGVFCEEGIQREIWYDIAEYTYIFVAPERIICVQDKCAGSEQNNRV